MKNNFINENHQCVQFKIETRLTDLSFLKAIWFKQKK